MKIKVDGKTHEEFTKRAMFLAWQACGGPQGMGALQDAPQANEDHVWANIVSAGDYPGAGKITGYLRPGRADADYVFGRMMKLHIKYDESGVEIEMDDWRSDYQSFCHAYPNAEALFKATAESLGCTYEPIAEKAEATK